MCMLVFVCISVFALNHLLNLSPVCLSIISYEMLTPLVFYYKVIYCKVVGGVLSEK